MNISYCSAYGEMSCLAAALVLEALKEKPDLLLCAATGSSPDGLYGELAGMARDTKGILEKLQILKLDEWGESRRIIPLPASII